MAKDATTSDEAPSELTLTEFCTLLSQSDKRVELIGAFNFVETKAGHTKDTEANFRKRFTAFINKPV
jgi:hypothetical protein